MSDKLRVLGLFQDEAALRDNIARNLGDLEPGLVATKTEYSMENPAGAGGRMDILALDEFDQIVVIELKRSDLSARSTLNELAKYVSLLVAEARVPKEAIRCIVLSTDWLELQLPLSFFAATAGVHVEGFKVIRDGDGIAYQPVILTPISNLPQFSPEFSIYQYLSESDRDLHLASIVSRAAQLPFVRLAVVLLDAETGSANTPYRSIACMWRLKPGDEMDVERITGNLVGHLAPYAYPGWEAECDVLSWIADDERPGVADVWMDEERGTPEKVHNLFASYRFAGVKRIGAWPKVDLVNSDKRILRQIDAVSSLVSAARGNRYTFHEVVLPRIVISWSHAIKAFLDFIGFEPVWRDAAQAFLSQITDYRARVTLHAFDKKHFFYAVHQARAHPQARLSNFQITVELPGKPLEQLVGEWMWDGKTCPKDARAEMERVFGSFSWAYMSVLNAVDQTRYERAFYDHGFRPVVYNVFHLDDGVVEVAPISGELDPILGIADFVAANTNYVNTVSDLFKEYPTGPGMSKSPPAESEG